MEGLLATLGTVGLALSEVDNAGDGVVGEPICGDEGALAIFPASGGDGENFLGFDVRGTDGGAEDFKFVGVETIVTATLVEVVVAGSETKVVDSVAVGVCGGGSTIFPPVLFPFK